MEKKTTIENNVRRNDEEQEDQSCLSYRNTKRGIDYLVETTK